MPKQTHKTFVYTTLALLAFAGNSVLCRLALGQQSIDPSSFTLLRLTSGIVVLMVLLYLSGNTANATSKGSWGAGTALFVYAIGFSFAYLWLDTGTGALVLFGAVQISMVISSVLKGYKLSRYELTGILLAFAGLAYLLAPSLSTPSLNGFLLMAIAGIAWAIYTLQGKHSLNPLHDTAYNFLRTAPFLVVLLLLFVFNRHAQISLQGVLLALASGVLCSGLGYAIWYKALPMLSTTQAAVLQLTVPAIATAGGVVLAKEPFTVHLAIASAIIIGGILLVIYGSRRAQAT